MIELGDEDMEFMEELMREGADSVDTVGLEDGGRSDIERETGGQQKRTQLKHMLFESIGE
jgi:hypothetical protein